MRASLKALIAMGLGGTILGAPGFVLEVQPPQGWTGTAVNSTYVESTAVANVSGDPAWAEPMIANMDVPEMYPIEPPSSSASLGNVITALCITGDPSSRGLKEIAVYVHNALVATIPGAVVAATMSGPNGAFGYPIRLSQRASDLAGGIWGAVNVTLVFRPNNGIERAVSRRFVLDHFSQRKTYWLDASAASEGDGSTEATPFKTFMNAQINAPDGARIKVKAGDYRVSCSFYGTGNNSYGNFTTGRTTAPHAKTLTFQASDGLTPDQIIVGLLPNTDGLNGSNLRGGFLFGNNNIHMRGITTDFTNVAQPVGYRGTGSAWSAVGFAGAYPNVMWERCPFRTDDGPNGVKLDKTQNNFVDPDDQSAIGQVGGLGYYYLNTVTSPDPTNGFFNTAGTWFSLMECTGVLISTKCAHFVRNCNIAIGFDSINMNAGTKRNRLRSDGVTPMSDSDDTLVLNTSFPAPCTTALRERAHDTPTVRIASMTGYSGSRTLVYTPSSGSASTTASTCGFTLVTFDNQFDGTVPNFKPLINGGSGSALRFLSPDVYGGPNMYIQGKYPGQAPGGSPSAFGWMPWFLGALPSGSTLTLDGTAITLQPNQCIIYGDITTIGAQKGTILTIFYPSHTDPFQWTGVALNQPNFENNMFMGYQAWGFGYGNLMLMQANSATPDAGTMFVDAGGNFTITGLSTGLWLGDGIIVVDTANNPGQVGQTAVVTAVTAGSNGLAGRIHRPFGTFDASGNFSAQPFTASGILINRYKSIRSTALINSRIAVGNFSQNGGGQDNIVFCGTTLMSIKNVAGIVANGCYTLGTGMPKSVVLRETILFADLGSSWNSINYTTLSDGGTKIGGTYYIDPRQAFYLIDTSMNDVVQKTGVVTSTTRPGIDPRWCASDFKVSGAAVSLTRSPLGVDYTGYPGVFPALTGNTRKSVSPLVAIDGLGNARAAGQSLVGFSAS